MAFVLAAVISAISSVVCFSSDTSENIAKAVLPFIHEHEGEYNTVVPYDNGAVSVGIIGWHGDNALELLRDIIDDDESQAKSLLGSDLYSEIISNSTSWSGRSLTAAETNAVKKLLETSQSKEEQDSLALKYVKNYIDSAKAKGLNDSMALAYFADYSNQMGLYAGLSKLSSIGSVSSVTLDKLYNATKGSTRRTQCYYYCLTLSFSDVSYKPGNYETLADSGLRIRSLPSTDSSALGKIPVFTKVKVTETNGVWGKVNYNGITGWICLSYAELVSSSQNTTTTKKAETTAKNSTDNTTYKTGNYTVTASSGLRIRSGAGTQYASLALIPYNEKVAVTQVSGSWGKVDYSGVAGWISLEYAKYSDSGSETTTKKQSDNSSVVSGDADGDGKITASDARLVLRYSASLENLSSDRLSLCDMNSDGKVNSLDARIILRKAAKLE